MLYQIRQVESDKQAETDEGKRSDQRCEIVEAGARFQHRFAGVLRVVVHAYGFLLAVLVPQAFQASLALVDEIGKGHAAALEDLPLDPIAIPEIRDQGACVVTDDFHLDTPQVGLDQLPRHRWPTAAGSCLADAAEEKQGRRKADQNEHRSEDLQEGLQFHTQSADR